MLNLELDYSLGFMMTYQKYLGRGGSGQFSFDLAVRFRNVSWHDLHRPCKEKVSLLISHEIPFERYHSDI